MRNIALTAESQTVLEARYLRKGETVSELFKRVAAWVAKAQDKNSAKAVQEYFDLLSSLEFLPNSPTLFNAGKPKAQLAACFVLPIEDSLEGIFETLKNAAIIHQSGGGTGFSFSRLRPANSLVKSTGGTASGPISFMHIYDTAAQVIKQGAARRGANMAILRVDHPDVFEFIGVKRNRNLLNNFNLSVGITDQFMECVRQDAPFELINPLTQKIAKKVRAREIFDLLTAAAWENGEPGLFFLDAVNRANPTPLLGLIEAPNPCSEQPLLPYESCVLGSVNLARLIKNDAKNRFSIDYDKLRQTVRTAVRFLDNVIDINYFPLPQVAEATRRTRKIGLGIMGLADLFILLDLPYASQEAVEITGNIMNFITTEARTMSAELGERLGSFPAFSQSVYPAKGFSAMRNATVTTIAPTGSISIIAGASSGIEPLFGLSMLRKVLDGQKIVNINQIAVRYLKERSLYSGEVERAIMSSGSVTNTNLDEKFKAVLSTAHEIPPKWHVEHLAKAQKYTDNGVSKTVNLPYNASKDAVAEVFWQAFESGCKGVTVYRDMSRNEQVLTHGAEVCNDCQI